MPPVEVCFDAAALSLTAAWAAGSTLALLLTRAGANAAKWGFRVFMLAVIVAYLNLPPAWPISWYGLAADLGLTTVALAWALGFAIVAGASLTALRRARRPVPENC